MDGQYKVGYKRDSKQIFLENTRMNREPAARWFFSAGAAHEIANALLDARNRLEDARYEPDVYIVATI